MRKFFLIVFVLFAANACAIDNQVSSVADPSNSSSNGIKDDWKVYSNDAYGFRVSYPSNWNIVDYTDEHLRNPPRHQYLWPPLVAFGPFTFEEEFYEGYEPDLRLFVYFSSEHESIDEYVHDVYLASPMPCIETEIKRGYKISIENIIIDRVPAYQIKQKCINEIIIHKGSYWFRLQGTESDGFSRFYKSLVFF